MIRLLVQAALALETQTTTSVGGFLLMYIHIKCHAYWWCQHNEDGKGHVKLGEWPYGVAVP